jgi:hypothetical protein
MSQDRLSGSVTAQHSLRSWLLSRHSLHYGALGIAGVVFLGSGVFDLLADGVAPGPSLTAVGGLAVVAASGYALAHPDAAETDVGGWVWFSVLGALLVILAATVTLAP